MYNQHKQISGYRDLSQAEINLMNEIEAVGPVLQALCDKVDAHIAAQRARISRCSPVDEEANAEDERLAAADPERWARWARDSMQANLMFLTRAVAQPTTF